MADHLGDPDPADDCVLQLSADDCGLSERGRQLYGGDGESGRRRGAAGGSGADDRLHSDGGGGDLGGRDGADFSGSAIAAVYAGDLPGDPGDSGDREYARREGHRRGVYSADVSVCEYAADTDRGGMSTRRSQADWHPVPVGTLPPALPTPVGIAGDVDADRRRFRADARR